MTLDAASIREGIVEERKVLVKLDELNKIRKSCMVLQLPSTDNDGTSSNGNTQKRTTAAVLSPAEVDKEVAVLKAQLGAIRSQRVIRSASIAGQTADLVIAIAQVEPNPLCCHPAVLGVSGLVAAWTGWFRVWA